MHIKTNIEQNMIQLIVIAVCPLILVVNTMVQGIFFSIATALCFSLSSIICGLLNKYFSRNVKVFITAVLSSFIIAIFNYMLKQEPKLGLQANKDCFYAVLSTICLSLDVYCINSKSVVKLHMIRTFFDCGIFAGVLIGFSTIVELFGSGSILGIHLFNPSIGAFFQSITFKLILLGLITIALDSVYRFRQNRVTEKKILYEKYVRKIRDEKMFLYDDFRRKKLLTSKVEINNVNQEYVDEINQKNAENQSLEEDVKESLGDDVNRKSKTEKGKSKLHVDVDRQEREKLSAKKAKEKAMAERGELVEEQKEDKKGKKKKGKDSKSSAKVEKVFGTKKGDKKN